MSYCTECGAKNAEEARFCNKCGMDLNRIGNGGDDAGQDILNIIKFENPLLALIGIFLVICSAVYFILYFVSWFAAFALSEEMISILSQYGLVSMASGENILKLVDYYPLLSNYLIIGILISVVGSIAVLVAKKA